MRKIIVYFMSVSSVSLMSLQQTSANTLVINIADFQSMQDNVRKLGEEVHKMKQIPRVPPGTVVAFAGEKDKVPNGWVLCDGRSLNRDEYRELFNVIGTAHGNGNGSTTFNAPDYRGYFLRGVSYEKSSPRDPSAEHRMVMNTGGNTGNKVGSIQPDSFKEHNHGSGNLNNSSSSVYISGRASPGEENRIVPFSTHPGGEHIHQITGLHHGYGSSSGVSYERGGYYPQSADAKGTSMSDTHSHTGSVALPDYSFSTSANISPQIISGATSNNGDVNETRPKNAYVNYIIKT
jgi:microcystin-dependent protein